MKKLILILLLAVGLSAGKLSQEHKDLAGNLVKVFGYQCNKVDNAIRSAWDGSIKVYCDGFANVYVVKKVGGRWTVRVRR